MCLPGHRRDAISFALAIAALTHFVSLTIHPRLLLRPQLPRIGDVAALQDREARDIRVKPHRVQRWSHSPDPDFRRKVRHVVRPYRHPSRGGWLPK